MYIEKSSVNSFIFRMYNITILRSGYPSPPLPSPRPLSFRKLTSTFYSSKCDLKTKLFYLGSSNWSVWDRNDKTGTFRVFL